MPHFRKKPVVIEARRVPLPKSIGAIAAYLAETIDLAEWCSGTSHMMCEDGERAYEGCEFVGPHISIETLEGTHAAAPGDWIIKGVAGEFYPCKPDIFDETYERVAGEVDAA